MNDCGCKIVQDTRKPWLSVTPRPRIEYCPLHRSAKQLRDALEARIEARSCPCCDATKAPHDEECTFLEDAPSDYEILMGSWERDADAQKALAASRGEKP